MFILLGRFASFYTSVTPDCQMIIKDI
uniref:Uncharacterized protein n=1 Tax=Anguilla anguilla TaxID=7936 RepID=A0A0E9W510_ANGAN